MAAAFHVVRIFARLIASDLYGYSSANPGLFSSLRERHRIYFILPVVVLEIPNRVLLVVN